MDTEDEREPSEVFATEVAEALRPQWTDVVVAGPVVVVSAENFSYVIEVHAVRKGAF